MKPQTEASTQEVLAGLVERITFHNGENGFCVLRAKARGHRDLVTVVGHAATISVGEWITASGEWVNDRTHGQHASSNVFAMRNALILLRRYDAIGQCAASRQSDLTPGPPFTRRLA